VASVISVIGLVIASGIMLIASVLMGVEFFRDSG